MAKPKKEEMLKLKPKRKYYAKFLGHQFDVPAVDKDGNPKIKRNAQGVPIYDVDGNEVPIHILYKFENIVDRAKQGYLSVFYFDPNDESAQNVALGKVLEHMSNKNDALAVFDEDGYDKVSNPAMFEEKKQRKAMEDELEALRKENEELKSPEALERRLEELTK
jgi:uncharacterized protein YrzB (UPF0473 family)